MYKDLIKRLRYAASYDERLVIEDCKEAADVIEELSKKRVGTYHKLKATQRSYSFVCNSCGSMYPYLTKCCPNCGVEYINKEPQKDGE